MTKTRLLQILLKYAQAIRNHIETRNYKFHTITDKISKFQMHNKYSDSININNGRMNVAYSQQNRDLRNNTLECPKSILSCSIFVQMLRYLTSFETLSAHI